MFLKIKTKNPKIIREQLSKEMGVSDSMTERYVKDLNMDSSYTRSNRRRKRTTERFSLILSEVNGGLTKTKAANCFLMEEN